MSTNSNIEWTETTWNPVTGCTEASTGCANCYARGMSKRLAAMARADEAQGKDPGKKGAYKLAVLEDGRWSGVVTPVPAALPDPLSWRKPRRVFVNSMSDLFWGTPTDLKVAKQRGVKDPQPVPFEFIDQVFAVMALCPRHTFQVLTKRPERMAEYLAYAHGKPRTAGGPDHPMIVREPTFYWQIERWLDEGAGGFFATDAAWDKAHARSGEVAMEWPLPNVWLGTSVENQATADERIPHLLKCPASVRWLSMEPLLGAVDVGFDKGWCRSCQVLTSGAIVGHCMDPGSACFDGETTVDAMLHWVVLGGESGKGARPMHPDWARSIRDQCQAAGVPFFFKQWGEFIPYEQDAQPPFWTSQHGDNIDGHALPVNLSDRIGELTAGWLLDSEMDLYRRVGKKAAGRLLDGHTWDEYPAVEGVNHA